MTTWHEVTIGEVTNNFDSKRVPIRSRDRKPGPYPYYGASGIVDWVDGFLFDGLYLLVAEDGENVRSRSTPLAFLADGRFWVNNHAHVIRGNHRADTRFLAYAIEATDVSGYVTGSAQPKLSQSSMNAIRLLLPPVQEQLLIASVLRSLDDKIELNRRMNRTLEQLATATFKAWFVDFEPVRAKADGANSFPGMPQSVFDALPTSFTDSELGPIPMGWHVVRLGEQAEITKGRSYKSSELAPSTVALVTLKSIERAGGYRPDGLKSYTGVFNEEQVVRGGDLVVAYTDLTHAAEVIGKPAIVWGDSRFELLVASLDIGILRPTGPLSVPYLYCLLRTDDFQTHIYGHTNGSTVLHLGKEGVPSYLMPMPPDFVRKEFDEFAAPVFRQIEMLARQSTSLSQARDALIPKLLTGEIRLPVREPAMEKVG